VAREAGVSPTAVSFAFNKPEQLNPQTAARIRQTAEALGYRPRPVATTPAIGRPPASMTIGLLVPQALTFTFADPVYAALCEGVAAAVDTAGYGLLMLSSQRGALARAIRHANMDGAVALGLDEDRSEIRLLRRAGLPLVLIDEEALPEHGSVISNDEVGARAAARHLLSLGHRRFAVVGIEPPSESEGSEYFQGPTEGVAARRLAGYRQGLALGGVKLGDSRVVVGPGSVDGGMAAFHRLWDDGLRPTAILAMSDVLASGVLRAARELGLRIPRDLSVVGFDDLELASRSNPPLTTVRQPIRQKGTESARILLHMIASPGLDRPEHRTLDTHLVVRSSSGPAPARGTERPGNRVRPVAGGAAPGR